MMDRLDKEKVLLEVLNSLSFNSYYSPEFVNGFLFKLEAEGYNIIKVKDDE